MEERGETKIRNGHFQGRFVSDQEGSMAKCGDTNLN